MLEAWEQRLLDQRLAVVVTARCYWCAWQQEGTVADTQAAYTEHRRVAHPEVTVKPRRKRHRPYRQMASETSLDDNIANARAQGAAGWAGSA